LPLQATEPARGWLTACNAGGTLAMTGFETQYEGTHGAELASLVRRLARAEEDLRARLVDRVAVLNGASRPFSDPLYQRLHSVLDGLTGQRVAAEAEAARRAGAPAP
jgi:hypothetical protein